MIVERGFRIYNNLYLSTTQQNESRKCRDIQYSYYTDISYRYVLTALFRLLQTQRSSMEHQKVCPQSASRIQLQRRSSVCSSLVQERLVTHRSAEAQKGDGRRTGKHRNVLGTCLGLSRELSEMCVRQCSLLADPSGRAV